MGEKPRGKEKGLREMAQKEDIKMSECELQQECMFLNEHIGHMPSTVQMVKQRYCNGNSNACARYMVSSALGKERVPGDMVPDQLDRARELILMAPHLL